MVLVWFLYYPNAFNCLTWCAHKFLVQWSCDSITESLVLPGIESRQIYNLCSKICLHVLIWNRISISTTAQHQRNVSVFIPPADSFSPPPLLFQDLFESSWAFCDTFSQRYSLCQNRCTDYLVNVTYIWGGFTALILVQGLCAGGGRHALKVLVRTTRNTY